MQIIGSKPTSAVDAPTPRKRNRELLSYQNMNKLTVRFRWRGGIDHTWCRSVSCQQPGKQKWDFLFSFHPTSQLVVSQRVSSFTAGLQRHRFNRENTRLFLTIVWKELQANWQMWRKPKGGNPAQFELLSKVLKEDERNVFENVTQEHNSMSPVWFCQNDSEQQTVFVYKKISCWCFRSNVFTEKGRREFLVSNESDYWWSQYGRKYVIFSPLTDVETCWNIQGEYFWSGPQFSQRRDGLVRSCVQKQQWEAQTGRVRMKPANISKYISSEF